MNSLRQSSRNAKKRARFGNGPSRLTEEKPQMEYPFAVFSLFEKVLFCF